MKKIIFIASIVFTFVAFNVALARDENTLNEFKARETYNLTGQKYQLHFLPVETESSSNFVSGKIEFSETEKTFTITLHENGLNHFILAGCPYENSMINSNRFTGHPPDGWVGSYFRIKGITFGSNYMRGIFQFVSGEYPPEEDLYLFFGKTIEE